MYDVLVIGARCAGAPTAMLLARKGYKVLLVDRATFPSNIPQGHFIHRHGPRRLKEWGLLDRIVSTGCPPVLSMTHDEGDFPLTGTDLSVDGVALGYAPRRAVLDQILVEAAIEAGAELREGFAVEEYLMEGDRVLGIRGRDRRSGSLVTERATMTVGADGRNSSLARTVQAPMYAVTPPVTGWYFSYWSGVPGRGLEIFSRNRRILFVFPTNDGLLGLFIGWALSEMPAVRADVEGQFLAAVDTVPDLAERVRNGRREERFYGTTNVPNFFRKPYGPGWALVGDASCHKDPFMALGICDAFRDAELLANALDEGLSGRRLLDPSLADYECQRTEATLPLFQQNLQMARFKPMPEEMSRLRAALRGNQEATNQFFLAREEMIAPETFFNPNNLQRLLAAGDPGDVPGPARSARG
jgi:flavin-dependent dehydrogenase